MKNPILVVMAAGMGSRYGGSKQIDPIGINNEVIIDYSIFDAVKAGFKRVIFIINREIEERFKACVGNRISNYIEVDYAYQDLDKLPQGYEVPNGRIKPWGTCHAILCAKDLIDAPFLVINADDYYGKDAFIKMFDFLSAYHDNEVYDFAMMGYILKNTLSENGTVARGICNIDEKGYLLDVVERKSIKRIGNDTCYTEDDGETWESVSQESIVSMNMWAFTTNILVEAENRFPTFLKDSIPFNPLKCEYFLPKVVKELLDEKIARVKVINTMDNWYGVTYKNDKPVVVNAIRVKHERGEYPTPLWQINGLNEVLFKYDFKGEILKVCPYGNGHINGTYCVVVHGENEVNTKYILQRINSKVFNRPKELMENIERVTDYMKEIIKSRNGDVLRETLNILKTKSGENYFSDSKGEVWRCFYFVKDTFCLEKVENSKQFYETGRSFGKFVRDLNDFPIDILHETIPKFHDTVKRINDLKKAIDENKVGRVHLVEKEINFLLKRENDCSYLVDKINKGILPMRVTHNDTKLNNILLDKESGKGICIIDLDTVMPGIAAYDFGDAIRFGATTALEDEKDTSKMHFDMELFKEYSRGYLSVAASVLSKEEIKALPWGARIMTLESAIRFLTDFINGDVYFKVHRESQNLDRARTQIKLIYEIEENWNEIVFTINKLANEF